MLHSNIQSNVFNPFQIQQVVCQINNAPFEGGFFLNVLLQQLAVANSLEVQLKKNKKMDV